MRLIHNFKFSMVRFLGIYVLLSLLMMRCKDPDLIISTTDDVNITGYLERFPDEYSQFRSILDITGNASFLAAYGTYTIFVPTNAAVNKFVQDRGKSSINELDVEELKKIVRFHLLQQVVSTQAFTDGKILQPTMYGQYLTTGAVSVGGEAYPLINKQAKVLKSNIPLGNGIMHVVDKVLEPATQTLAQMIEANPEYLIFTQAMKATGHYEMLNVHAADSDDPERQWFTLLAESNTALADAGYNSFDELKNRLSHLGDPTNPADSLYLYVAYHILPRNSYLADLITSTSHATVAPLEVITTRLDGTTVLINSDEVNGVREPGSRLNRPGSDFSATNGVLHDVQDHFRIKIRRPLPVYWEVTDQPEIRRMVSVFRMYLNTGISTPSCGTGADNMGVCLYDDALSEISWPKHHIGYVANGDAHTFRDWFRINIRPAHVPEITFTTPLLARGKYKVWICYRRVNTNDIQAFFNGVPLPRLFGLNPTPGYPGSLTPEEAEAQGWKLYTEPTNGAYVGRMIGVVDVETTGRHKLRFLGLTNRGGSTGNAFRLDMIHFIPLEMDQISKRFRPDGTSTD